MNRLSQRTSATRAQLVQAEPTHVALPTAKLQAGHIRCVRILPPTPGHGIRCNTRIFRVPSDVRYTALSYAWGNPTLCNMIEVDGHPQMIAGNLWQFLRQASDLPQRLSQWLWIDALSIDQSNMEERAHQVGIMSDIFRKPPGWSSG